MSIEWCNRGEHEVDLDLTEIYVIDGEVVCEDHVTDEEWENLNDDSGD